MIPRLELWRRRTSQARPWLNPGLWAAMAGLLLTAVAADVPANLVVEEVPAIPAELKASVRPYLEFRSALFQDWHPERREILITTRFGQSMQLHAVARPGGARQQLTFRDEPVAGATFRPTTGAFVVFSQDEGGGEFFQLYRFEPGTGRVTRLTDGKSRNLGMEWSDDGRWLAYTSTRRNGKDNDLWVMDPAEPSTDRMVLAVEGGGWSVLDWSPDGRRLLVVNRVSINETYLWLVEVASGAKELLTPKSTEPVAYGSAQFSRDGRSVFLTTDQGSEFQRLVRMDLEKRVVTPLTAHLAWDVTEFDLSPDGKTVALVTNEDGLGVLHLLDAQSGKERKAPRLPAGVPTRLKWHPQGRHLAFNFTSARTPADVYSVDTKTGVVERWTESETGGVDPAGFAEPELVKIQSFDGLPISGFLYRPDAAKFPGKRPVMVVIHGGPEAQSRPTFLARNNYFLNELGIALLYPNVRGSSGYGKTFLTLDNGFKREDSVKDIGAFLQWIRSQPELDGDRVCVYGGSYGGYMVLASLVHFGEQLRCGIDVVGISNFLTFLANTQDYRRDLRRVEYGDERNSEMRAYLERISPARQAARLTKPLLVVQGQNDPRVPASESAQMVQAIRHQGGRVWYVLARDEGHGFQKKANVDYMFEAMVAFLQEQLLAPATR